MDTPVILGVVTVAGYFDARWRRVPNWLAGSFLLAALAWHAVRGALGASAAGLLFGLLLLFPLFALRGLGAGDVKFFAALGAAVTYRVVPVLLLVTALVAAGAALALVLRRGLLPATLRNLGRLCRAPFGRGGGRTNVPTIDTKGAVLVPFTAAAAVATWLVLLGARG